LLGRASPGSAASRRCGDRLGSRGSGGLASASGRRPRVLCLEQLLAVAEGRP
jgi:hypothetical protein